MVKMWSSAFSAHLSSRPSIYALRFDYILLLVTIHNRSIRLPCHLGIVYLRYVYIHTRWDEWIYSNTQKSMTSDFIFIESIYEREREVIVHGR